MPAHEEVNLRGRAFSAAPAEAGASPYLGSSDAQSLPRSSPIGGCERIYIICKGEACFGFWVCACGQGVGATYVCGRVVYGAVCIRTLR